MGMDDIYRFVDYFFAAQPSKRGNPLQKFFFFSPMSRARPGTGLVPMTVEATKPIGPVAALGSISG